MSQTRPFKVVIVDVPEFGKIAENNFYCWSDVETKINGKEIKAHVYSDPLDAKSVLDGDEADAVLYIGMKGKKLKRFLRDVEILQDIDGREIPKIDMLNNKHPLFLSFIEEYKKHKSNDQKVEIVEKLSSASDETSTSSKDESTAASSEFESFKSKMRGENKEEIESNELCKEIDLLFTSLNMQINRCDDANVSVAAKKMRDKIYTDFQDNCVGVSELNTVKAMTEKVVQVLDAYSALVITKKDNIDIECEDIIKIPECDAVESKLSDALKLTLSDLKSFTSTTYEKLHWGESIAPITAIFAGAIMLAVGAVIAATGVGLIPGGAMGVLGIALVTVGIFGLKSSVTERSTAVESLAKSVQSTPTLS